MSTSLQHRPADAGLQRPQRANGSARFSVQGGQTGARLERLFQEGSAKVRFTAPALTTGAGLDAVLINTAGGMTGGDHFDWSVDVGRNTHCTVVTQACEKIYRSENDAATVEVKLQVREKASLDWLPQETIAFEGARLKRTLDADLAAGARLLAVEAVVLGRRAMGETVRNLDLRDRWRIRREGRLVFADDVALAFSTAQGQTLPDPAHGRALLDGAGAYASVLCVDDEAEGLLDGARAALGPRSGASAFGGKLFCRILAQDGFALRRTLIPLLVHLRGGQPLPRLWTL
jgi:urease accessory protein